MSPPFTSAEEKTLNYLYGLQRLGIKVGLDHTIKLLRGMGNPQNSFKTIHVAGTNGKGSTAAMTASILRQAGYKVGLYTSPHLLAFNERIRINGKAISSRNILSFIQDHKKEIEQIKSTFFETTTAMAFQHFAENKVDAAVVETGLGGRLDSTNVINPEVTVITPIALDHREILGDNIISIAKEKAGIIKSRTPLVLARQDPEVIKIIESRAQACCAPVIKPGAIEKENLKLSQDGTQFYYNHHIYNIPMLGLHQASNAAAAIEAVLQFAPELKLSDVKKGLESVIWPGRLQPMSIELPIFYDVAHNAQGLIQVARLMGGIFPQKPVALLALKGDKEIDLIAQALQKEFGLLIISGSQELGLMNAQELGSKLKSGGLRRALIIEQNFKSALEMLINMVNKQKIPGLILGSHYIAAAVFKRFKFSFSNQ